MSYTIAINELKEELARDAEALERNPEERKELEERIAELERERCQSRYWNR